MTFEEFMRKVEWEGGYESAMLDYGLNPSDIESTGNKEHLARWFLIEMYGHYQEIGKLQERLDSVLDRLKDDGGEV
jgi:hypothetical protein